ncbi:hypothetical protein L484_004163 [Morus notabilis]|uniref:Uncharacterized protein n=1 Tax=Morus notabilis TaxID=981085 RepID=W9R0N1_9ROSA|nr:hypothetical protein L484_004163 [Morus notabilis]
MHRDCKRIKVEREVRMTRFGLEDGFPMPLVLFGGVLCQECVKMGCSVVIGTIICRSLALIRGRNWFSSVVWTMDSRDSVSVLVDPVLGLWNISYTLAVFGS